MSESPLDELDRVHQIQQWERDHLPNAHCVSCRQPGGDAYCNSCGGLFHKDNTQISRAEPKQSFHCAAWCPHGCGFLACIPCIEVHCFMADAGNPFARPCGEVWQQTGELEDSDAEDERLEIKSSFQKCIMRLIKSLRDADKQWRPLWFRPDPRQVGSSVDDWREARTQEGRVYYYHKQTREARWEMPLAAGAAVHVQAHQSAVHVRPLQLPQWSPAPTSTYIWPRRWH